LHTLIPCKGARDEAVSSLFSVESPHERSIAGS
jgi:hypothetical protein